MHVSVCVSVKLETGKRAICANSLRRRSVSGLEVRGPWASRRDFLNFARACAGRDHFKFTRPAGAECVRADREDRQVDPMQMRPVSRQLSGVSRPAGGCSLAPTVARRHRFKWRIESAAGETLSMSQAGELLR